MIVKFELEFEADVFLSSFLIGWFECLKETESLTTEQVFICSLFYSSKIGFPLNATFKQVFHTLKDCNFDFDNLKFRFLGCNSIH